MNHRSKDLHSYFPVLSYLKKISETFLIVLVFITNMMLYRLL